MIYVEGLINEGGSSTTAYFLFLLQDAKSPNEIHAFFEGHGDASFYMNFLRGYTSASVRINTYKCGNKRGVYQAYRKVMSGPLKGTPLFFVDKDLSDILNEDWEIAPNIYVTDYYSIENYLVSEDILFRIWIELFHFKNVSLEFGNVHRDKFYTELERFYQFILPIMAWTIYMRKIGKKPNVNNIKFTKFFRFIEDLTLEKSEEAQKIGDIRLLEQVCNVVTPEDWLLESELIIRDLSALSPKSYIRGKLELCFFVNFVKSLRKLLDRYVSDMDGRVGMEMQLSEDNAIQVLGPRMLIPLSLERFLHENLPITT